MAEAVVDLLEVVDVEHQRRHRLAIAHRAGHQGVQLAGHVAAIVQPRELVGHRRFQALVQVVAQIVGVALALDLGPRPRRQLLRIDGARQDVVDPDVQGADAAIAVVRIDQRQDGQVAGALVRAQLGAEAQAVEAARHAVDDHQVHGPAGGQMRLGEVGLDHGPMLHRQFRGQALGLAIGVVDDQHTAAGSRQAAAGRADQADAPPGILAVTQFVQHDLQPGQAAHAREQDEIVDRLGEEFVGARLQPRDAVGAAVQGGDQHHWDVAGGGVVLQPTADLEAVHAGHHHVQQDDVRLFRRRDGQAGDPVGGGQHLIVVRRELGLEQSDVRVDIVDNQDPRGHLNSPKEAPHRIEEVRH